MRTDELNNALGALQLYPEDNDLPLLLLLSEGSVGTAANILQIDGLGLYREVEKIIETPWSGIKTLYFLTLNLNFGHHKISWWFVTNRSL